MKKKNKDYLSVIYNEDDKPFTKYPADLTKYLTEYYSIDPNSKLLDIGCGRGEFLDGFSKCGLNCFGVDQFNHAENYFPKTKLKISDLENEKLPYDDNYFDVVFSKSVIEHFYYPEKLIKEILRVLKPNGKVLTLTPDWEYNYVNFYEDYTHRTPFTIKSLKDIFLIHNFKDVEVSRFKQLPILWHKNKILSLLSEFTRILSPNFLKNKSKWVRFSKEIMLISIAYKPEK